MDSWERLADIYEFLQVKEDSLDTLVEYPAQRRAMSDIRGKRILDVGCGSGRKALDWSVNGAREVWGFDNNSQFAKCWPELQQQTENLKLFTGDLSAISKIELLSGEKFDLITSFQALMYSEDIAQTIREVRELVPCGGRFVFSVPHPCRFLATEYRHETPPARFYREETQIKFRSQWSKQVIIQHAKPMFSTWVNNLLTNGFNLINVEEPSLSVQQRAQFPHKAEWMDSYFGCLVFSTEAV